MRPLTLRIIQDEHSALAAMLRSLPLLMDQHRRDNTLPDFAALRAMLFYVDEFPERLHHPKESHLLFPKLRARAPQLREVLDQLDEDHARGERSIRELEHALLGFEMMGFDRRDAFEGKLRHYVQTYLRHMALEERDILPAAQQFLHPEDWQDLDEAFASNRDPLTGHEPDGPYQALFRQILTKLPTPLGLA